MRPRSRLEALRRQAVTLKWGLSPMCVWLSTYASASVSLHLSLPPTPLLFGQRVAARRATSAVTQQHKQDCTVRDICLKRLWTHYDHLCPQTFLFVWQPHCKSRQLTVRLWKKQSHRTSFTHQATGVAIAFNTFGTWKILIKAKTFELAQEESSLPAAPGRCKRAN